MDFAAGGELTSAHPRLLQQPHPSHNARNAVMPGSGGRVIRPLSPGGLCVLMCIYVHMCVYLCVYVYVCVCAYMHICIFLYK